MYTVLSATLSYTLLAIDHITILLAAAYLMTHNNKLSLSLHITPHTAVAVSDSSQQTVIQPKCDS